MKNKVDASPFFEAMKKMNKVPVGKFDGVGWATVTSANPLKILVDNGVELSSTFIEKSPFCEMVVNKIYSHSHRYKEKNDGQGSSGPVENPITEEVIFPVIVMKPLQKGEKVCVLRTNESQKYIILWREKTFVEGV